MPASARLMKLFFVSMVLAFPIFGLSLSNQNSPARIVLVIDNSGSMCRSNGIIPASDPTNMRTTIANAFADSLYKSCKDCEIGVIIYKDDNMDDEGALTVIGRLDPLNVGVAGNLTLIHAAINSSACGSDRHKITTTYSGTALDTAVQNMIDDGYDSLVAHGLVRHIIMLTDGDWLTPVAVDIYTQYVANYPGRPFPTIHGVFLGDGSVFDVSNLDTATRLSTRNKPPYNTAGKFFLATTPAAIGTAFDTLLNTIITRKTVIARNSAERLQAMLLPGKASKTSLKMFDTRGRLVAYRDPRTAALKRRKELFRTRMILHKLIR